MARGLSDYNGGLKIHHALLCVVLHGSRRYRDVATRVADVVDAVTTRGQAVRADVADAVGRGAREVERFAIALEDRTHSKRSGASGQPRQHSVP
jgi:hypothetical protein